MAAWLLLPGLSELRRPFQLYRDASAALQAARLAGLRLSETENADAAPTPEHQTVLQIRTCRLAHLFGALLTVVMLWWTKLLLVNREGLFSLGSAECLMLGLMFGVQMLVKAFLNWKVRGGYGGMPAFLAGSRGRWPR